MQNVDHADVLHLFALFIFIKEFEEGEEKGKENIGGGICLWLVWVYVEKWIDDDDDDDDSGDGDDVDRQSPFFFFSFSWYMYMYMYLWPHRNNRYMYR